MGRGAKIFFVSGAIALLAFGLIAYFIVSAIFGVDPGKPSSADTETGTQGESTAYPYNYDEPAAVGRGTPDADAYLLCCTF